MQVHVVMPIPVRRREAEGMEARKLPLDFCAQLLIQVLRDRILPSRTSRGGIELPAPIREVRKPRSRAIAQREMQPHAQSRAAARDLHCLVHCRFIDHKAGLRQRSRDEVAFDRFVHFAAASKVVAGEEQVFQRKRERSEAAVAGAQITRRSALLCKSR